MADDMSSKEFDQENSLAIVVVDQPTKTVEPRFYEGTMFGLPWGWIVEIRPRKASSKYHGKVDQFFYEPRTRRQFRSLKAVRRYLGIEMGQPSRKKKRKASKAAGHFENLYEKNKFETEAAHQFENVDEKEKDGPSSKVDLGDKDGQNYKYFDKIAQRIRWQLIHGEQNSWQSYVKVPDSVQNHWMDMFLKPHIFNQDRNQ